MNFELGRTYSGYEFLDVVNRSRNVITYRVRNPLTHRQEFLQVLPPSAQEDPQRVERFMREMRVRASLTHPNIAVFYNAAEIEGQLVMTTELVEGPTLAERLKLGPLPWREAVSLVRQALSALAAAHLQNVVHRDISPDNVVVTPDGILKLTNFGLAKMLNGPQLTHAGAILGNLKYISPEQVRGDSELDARSDIYSLGTVMYEMLCGKPPFDARSEFELMLAHVNEHAAPPSAVNIGVPREFDAVVLKALAKAPAERYQNAGEFFVALHAASTAAEQPAQAAEAQPIAAAPIAAEAEQIPGAPAAVEEAAPAGQAQPVEQPAAVQAETVEQMAVERKAAELPEPVLELQAPPQEEHPQAVPIAAEAEQIPQATAAVEEATPAGQAQPVEETAAVQAETVEQVLVEQKAAELPEPVLELQAQPQEEHLQAAPIAAAPIAAEAQQTAVQAETVEQVAVEQQEAVEQKAAEQPQPVLQQQTPAAEPAIEEQPQAAPDAALFATYAPRKTLSLQWSVVSGAVAGVCATLLAIWFAAAR